MDIVTRQEWGAAEPSSPLQRIPLPSPVVYIHHSAAAAQGNAAVRNFQRYHMTTKNMRDIAYSFLIGDKGEVYVGRGSGYAHGGNTGEDNRISHSICFMGNFEVQTPSDAAVGAATELLGTGKANGWWLLSEVRPHSGEPGASTACPGRYLRVRIPSIVVAARVYALNPSRPTTPVPPTTPTTPEEIDMTTEYVFDCDGMPAIYFVNGTWQHINGPQREVLRSVDVPARKLSIDHYNGVKAFPQATR